MDKSVNNQLIEASKGGNLNEVKDAIENGADVNVNKLWIEKIIMEKLLFVMHLRKVILKLSNTL